MRFRRPPQSTIDHVHISREGSSAIIEYADPAYGTVNFKLGPEIDTLSDREILEMFNDVIAAQEASIADPANRPIEIPKGRRKSNGLKMLSWSARGVLKCEVSDNELALSVQQSLGRNPHAGEIFCFRGKPWRSG